MSSSDSFQEAAHFRETFGLDTDPALIQRAAEDPAYSSDPYGVPLSKDEIAELQRRVGAERTLWDAVAYAEKQPEWAGYFIDQLDRGTPVFRLTAGGDKVAAGIRSRVPTDINIRFEDASHSLGYLLELEETIFADREALASEGIALTGLATDVVANSVDIAVEKLSDEVETTLKQRYGEALTFRQEGPAEADACVSTENCRPMKGGLHIHNTEFAEGVNDCTSGFVIRRWKDGSWPLAILTAGHCVAHGVNEWWEHNNLPLGKSKYQTWGSTVIDGQVRNSDVGVIEIYDVNGSIPPIANQLFVYNGTNHVFSVPTYIPTSNQTTGSQACAYGYFSNSSHCVTIKKTNVKHTSPSWGVTHWIMNTIEYDWNLLPGDSGGPIYQQWGDDRAAMGTHVHSTSGGGDTGYGWYTPILVGQADYNNVTTAQGNPDSFVLCMDANC